MRRITCFLIISFTSIQVFAQTTSEWQIWSNAIVGAHVSNHIYLHADIRHRQTMGSSSESWQNSGIKLMGEYSINKLFTASFELVNNHTKQSSAISNYEFAQRLGLKLYIFRNGVNLFKLKKGLEGTSAKTELTNLVRFDHRIFTYPDEDITDYHWRFRNRIQIKHALNKETLLENKLLVLNSDIEFFIPLNTEPNERHLSKIRFRIGPEYKYSSRWKFRLMYAFDHAGNGFSNNDNIETQMLIARIKYTF